MQTVLKDLDTRMNSALDVLSREFVGVRTGRASAGLLDSIRVDYYGNSTPISQMASVSVPDARTLMIQPWEAAQLKEIEKAIMKSDLGIQPVTAHVAIIMDGNGRWATQRGLPRVAGHREGVKAARAIVRAADAVGLRFLTLYAFSTENWSRPEDEVTMLMRLLEESIYRELPELMENRVRLRVIGRTAGVPLPVRRGLEHVARETQDNTGLTLLMAFNYGGRDELLDAFRALARSVQAGELAPEAVSEADVSRALYTDGVPDPDLLIRTSGEMRVSNFLLWQIAYTELWVTPTLWPDFEPADLYRAIADYQRRDRRFGGV